MTVIEDCWNCGGDGFMLYTTGEEVCDVCMGDGRVESEEEDE